MQSWNRVSNSDIIKGQPDGAVLHSDWDNFDQLVSDVYEAGSIHTAAGMYMQDIASCAYTEALTSEQPTQKSNPKTQPTKK